jgi:hypothetical protein
MLFVAGRETDTSICTSCYATVRPRLYQTLAGAEKEHSCGTEQALKPAPQKAPPGVAEKAPSILLQGSWRSDSMPDWEACTFRLTQAVGDSVKQVRETVKPPDDRKLLP